MAVKIADVEQTKILIHEDHTSASPRGELKRLKDENRCLHQCIQQLQQQIIAAEHPDRFSVCTVIAV